MIESNRNRGQTSWFAATCKFLLERTPVMSALLQAILLGQLLSATNARAVVTTKEYWIDDDGVGTFDGSLANPFDGSTQAKFDSIMSQLTTNQNITIHLLPGTYRTSGAYPHPWLLDSGTRLVGAGTDVTIIKLQDNPPSGAAAVVSKPATIEVEVRDMTVDCNGSTSSSQYVANGVVLWGERSVIRRVKVINTIGVHSETFPIYIQPLNSDSTSNPNGIGSLISECEVSSVLGSAVWTSCSAIGIDAGEGTIEKCRVILPILTPAGTTNTTTFAYNCANVKNLRLIGNYSQGGSEGFYADTQNCTNLLIADNIFKNCWAGIYLGYHDYADDVLIRNNIIEPNPTLTNTWVYGVAVVPNLQSHCLTIRGNTVRWPDGQSGGSQVRAFDVRNYTGAIINDNVFDSSMALYSLNCTNLSVFNNHDLSGNLLTSFDQAEPPNSIQRRTLTATATLLPTDKFIGVQTTSAITLTLPTAAGVAGKEIIISAEASSPNVTIIPSLSQTINGSSSSKVITTGYTSLKLISDGSNWFTW